MSCVGCPWLMIGKWSPWCFREMAPLLFVERCPLADPGDSKDSKTGRPCV